MKMSECRIDDACIGNSKYEFVRADPIELLGFRQQPVIGGVV
jgi:hypothetical protein